MKSEAEIKALDAKVKTVKLSEFFPKNAGIQLIARNMIKFHGEYKTMVGGEPVRVVAG